jgi:hypothetical protein
VGGDLRFVIVNLRRRGRDAALLRSIERTRNV